MSSVRLSLAVLLVLLSSVGSTQFDRNRTDGSENRQNQSEIQDLRPGETPPAAQVKTTTDIAGQRVFNLELEEESRIIGGQESWAHSWPWQVSLQFATMPACGGAIISPLWVLSAAHCFRRSEVGSARRNRGRALTARLAHRYSKASFWTVAAGKHDLDNSQEAGQQVVEQLHHHRLGLHPRERPSGPAAPGGEREHPAAGRLRPLLPGPGAALHVLCWAGPGRRRRLPGTGSSSARVRSGASAADAAGAPRGTREDPCPASQAAGTSWPAWSAGASAVGGPRSPASTHTCGRTSAGWPTSWTTRTGCTRAAWRPRVGFHQHTHARTHTRTHTRACPLPLPEEEDECGKQPRSSCVAALGPAHLWCSEKGEELVENVVESCPSSWPWQVSLQSHDGHYCSGTLIQRRWVLTARHCEVRAREDVVVLGVHDLRFSSQTIMVDQVFNLPDDGRFPPKSDLSLLRLSAPARLTSNVSPACVPDEDEEPNDSWSCVTTGWGAVKAKGTIDPNRLHQVGLTLVNQTSCRQRWGGGLIQDSHVCSHPAGSASCMVSAALGCPLLRQQWHLNVRLSAGGFRSSSALPETQHLLPVWGGHMGQQRVWLRQTRRLFQDLPLRAVDLGSDRGRRRTRIKSLSQTFDLESLVLRTRDRNEEG
ncbi:unnamed protein product [Tetraodon nigroviridis]|uniref:(spotted green pufferfish) hypothetical protein n=1 Tax=Tetraodon nigroviridis TaxID=99883 RepID=Q4T8G8_TETNG|nr:unnamed protein product [Tetraodon nigroviridis]